MENKNEILKSLKKVKLFSGLSSQELLQILNLSKIKSYGKGMTVFSQNTSGKSLYIILKGMIKIFEQTEKRKKILAYMGEREFFGELALLGKNVRSATAQTVTNVEVIIIDKNEFLKLIKNYPVVCFNLLKEISNRLLIADKEIALVTFQDVPRRIAKILLNLSKSYGKATPLGRKIDIVLGHKELAELAGTVRETAARICSKLKKMNYIGYSDKYITILNEDGLTNFAN